MWSFMESARPSVFTSSNIEGVERVVKGKGKEIFLHGVVHKLHEQISKCEGWSQK